MNIKDFTFVYFIEDYNQEKLIYLKHQDNLNIFLIYSNLKPKLFTDNLYITDKNYFNEVIGEIFFKISTDYFIYLKPEETLPFINPNKSFDLSYYFFEIEYHFKSNKLITNELRLYNKKKILSDGIEELIQQNNQDIKINNYQYFYPQTVSNILKKHLKLLKNDNYKEESIIYVCLNNLKEFVLNNLKSELALDDKSFIKLKDNLPKESYQYFLVCLNIIIFKIKKSDYQFAHNYINELNNLFPANLSLTFLTAFLYKIEKNFDKAIEYFDKCLNLKIADKTYIFPYSWLDYEPNLQKGHIYFELGNIKQAILEYEEALNKNPDKNTIKEINIFLDKYKEKVVETDFTCQSCGNCCRYKAVNITHNDLQRILDNKPELSVDGFIEFIEIPEESGSYNHGDKLQLENKRKLMILKKKKNIKECVFLENNMCSINNFKPLVCKTWPFVIRESDNQLMWNLHERQFIDEYCAHTLSSNNDNITVLNKDIANFKQDRSKFFEAVYSWNNYNQTIHNENNFMDFILKFSDKNKSQIEVSLKEVLKDFFQNDSNISILEFNPFISKYFPHGSNVISFAVHINADSFHKYLNQEYFDNLKSKLNSQAYNISNIPQTCISYFFNDDIYKYVANIYFYPFVEKALIWDNSELLFNNTQPELYSFSEMFDYQISYLQQFFKTFTNNIINNFNQNDLTKNVGIINNIIFSLISWLSKNNFELLKHNNYSFIDNSFNDFILSNYQLPENKQDLIRFISLAEKIFYKLIDKSKNITLI